ncbi:MAG: MFS transporter, partial [Deltaproteobacteria bacterium]|nr:MFS transporter [Deltaproteobacteria bacterium]
LHGLAGALWNPSRQLMIYDVVGPETLQSGIRLLATGRQLGILFGPAVGGGVLLLLKPTLALCVNALIYLPLVIWCRMVPYTGHGSGRQTRKGGWAEALSALWGASHNRVLLAMIVLVGCYAFFVGNAFQALMPAFAVSLGAEELGFGYAALFAANGAGAVAGGLLLESFRMLKARASAAILLAILWCCAMTAFAVTSNYPLALLFLFFAGILNLAFLSMAQTLVQLEAPENLRGRLIGLYNMSAQGLRTFSGVTVGFFGAVVGINWSLGISTLVVLVIAAVLLLVTLRGARPPEAAAA